MVNSQIRVNKKKNHMLVRMKKAIKRDKYLYILALPAVIYYVIFHYWPMYGVTIAFKDFIPIEGILGSPWIGFENFKNFFSSYFFVRLIRNTLLLSLINIVFAFPVPIFFALMVNEVRNKTLKKSIQTISYFPHFISVVIVVGMMFDLLNSNNGVANQLLNMMGKESISFMTTSSWFRPIYVISDIWQHFGWGSIIYLAALTGIDPQLYEAASIDGATRLKSLIHITLPSLAPTIIIMLILRLGRVMNVGFEKVFLMQSPGIYETADVIQTYVYRRGLIDRDYSFAAAVGLFNSVINFVLVVSVNRFSRKITETSLW